MASRRNPSRNADLAGAPPKLATMDDLAIPTAAKTGRAHPVSKSASTSKAPHRINLRAVAEACIEEGLDPAVEIAKALKATIPLVRGGQPVLDHDVPYCPKRLRIVIFRRFKNYHVWVYAL